ncbi:hypothetical protein L2E82_53106 [Cichorium intybus]|nr:hypothetical protein L2E82_53106 [Cichorium intybus]
MHRHVRAWWAVSKRNATWLILPVVICLSQRLSHACDPLEGKSGASSSNESGNWNEYNLNPLTRIHWRASLVPAAAIIAIVGLQRGIPSKRESSARVDYVPALCTHRPSLLPIEWSGEVLGSRRRGRFAAGDVARIPLNLII